MTHSHTVSCRRRWRDRQGGLGRMVQGSVGLVVQYWTMSKGQNDSNHHNCNNNNDEATIGDREEEHAKQRHNPPLGTPDLPLALSSLPDDLSSVGTERYGNDRCHRFNVTTLLGWTIESEELNPMYLLRKSKVKAYQSIFWRSCAKWSHVVAIKGSIACRAA